MFKKIGFWVFVVCIILSTVVYLFMADCNEYKANVVVETLSIGITAGLIDFLANDIPQIKKKKNTKKILSYEINWLCFTMEEIINTSLKVFGINKTMNELKQFDLSGLSGNLIYSQTTILKKFSIIRRNGTNTQIIDGTESFSIFIKESIETIKNQIEKILRYEYLFEYDKKFVDAITRIKLCSFIESYEYKKLSFDVSKKDESVSYAHLGLDVPCFLYADSHKSFYELIELYQNLISLKYHTEDSKCEVLVGNEITKHFEQ